MSLVKHPNGRFRNLFVDESGARFRQCKMCQEMKPENEENYYLVNYTLKTAKGGTYQCYETRCIECLKKKATEYAEENADKIALYRQSEHFKQLNRAAYKKSMQDPEKRAKKQECGRKSKDKHRERKNAARRTTEGRAKRRLEHKKRLMDPVFRMRANISNAIFKALRKGKSSKAGQSILKYLAYTINDLKIHIENQFDEHMSWANYGSYWHVDHIIPQSDLPYLSMEDENFKVCWALENLRPLEASQNIQDGARRVRHKKIS